VYLYHQSPKEMRDAILAEGLRVSEDRTGHGAVFFSTRPADDGCRFVTFEVDAAGLELHEDWSGEPPDGEQWFAVFADISASRIRVLARTLVNEPVGAFVTSPA
jgi:hypothetical protein